MEPWTHQGTNKPDREGSAVILNEDYLSYNDALEVVGVKTLAARRQDLCLKFAEKALKHSKFSNLYA